MRLPGHGHSSASVVVRREMLPLGQDVRGHVIAELKRMAAIPPDFSQMGRLPIDWPDRIGEAIITRWRSDSRIDGRRVATRFDRCPTAFFSAAALAATVIVWL